MSFYDEIEFEDLTFDEDAKHFTYPCPCGDDFIIALKDLLDGEDTAKCPSCTLQIRVIYDIEDLEEIELKCESVLVC